MAFLFLNSSQPKSIAQSYTEWKFLDAHRTTLCAVKKSDGTLECWGHVSFPTYDQLPSDSGYETVHLGRHDAAYGPRWYCALKTNGSAKCWGVQSEGQPGDIGLPGDTDKYHDISLGYAHACWILRDDGTAANDGKVECETYSTHSWAATYGMGSVPSDLADYKFSSVKVTYWDSCAVVEDSDRDTAGNQDEGQVKCWGFYKSTYPSDQTFKSIARSELTFCGIIEDSDTTNTTANDDEDGIKCWGSARIDADRKHIAPTGMTFKSVAPGNTHTCAVVKDSDTSNQTDNDDADSIECWGNHFDGKIGAPLGTYKGLTSHLDYSCAITIDSNPLQSGNQNSGAVACWGDTGFLNVSIPAHWHNSLEDDTNVPDPNLPTATPTAIPQRDAIDSISLGEFTTCMLTDAGDVRCFGRNILGEGVPPDGIRADNVILGKQHACIISHYGEWGKNPAVTTTNVVCWGDDQYGQSTPPEGAFVAVAAGSASTCGVKTDGSVKCWGINQPPNLGLIEGAPTATNFVDVKIGYTRNYEHACALATDGSVTCWGNSDRTGPDSGETNVPAGFSFKAIDVGSRTSCGIVRGNDTVKCWGKGLEHASDDHESSIKNFPSTITFKEISTDWQATCGMLKEDYHVARPTSKYSVWQRKTDQPYCQGNVWRFTPDAATHWNSDASHKFFRYYPATDPDDNFDQTYRDFHVVVNRTCAIREDETIECAGDDPAERYGSLLAPAVATVTSASANQTYTCGSDTYNGASTIDGGRFPATGGAYYVSIPAGALANNTIIGVRMAQGSDANFPDTSSGHKFVGKIHSVSVKNASDCSDPSGGVTTTQPVDVCLPKPSNLTGRWHDWRLYEVENGQVTSTWYQGFTVLDGAVCGEVNELPVSVAAAQKPLPVRHPHDGDYTKDLVVEAKLGISALTHNVYVRVRGETLRNALPSGTARLEIRHVDPSRPLVAPGNIFKVGDLYVEINLVSSDDVDIGANLNPPAEICIEAPAGLLGPESIYHLGDAPTDKWGKLPPLDTSLLTGRYAVYGTRNYACGVSSTLSTFVATSIQATPIALPKILRISPRISSLTLSANEKVRLSVDAFGLQNILDNTLAEDVTFEWSVEPSGGTFKEADREADADDEVDDREVLFTAPPQPGRYTLKVGLDRFECGDDDGRDDGCEAEVSVNVRRTSATPEPTATPANPAGEIPSVIVDDDGNQYEVFTPEEGGEFIGEDVSVSAEPGAVPNGEIIGVRADAVGQASNVGKVHDRVTLEGEYFDISAVDVSGRPLRGYQLDDPATVCIPLPPRIASQIAETAIVSLKSDGTFAVLSSRVRLTADGATLCGALSELSARVAAAHLASPSALPSATPLPTPVDPDTGGESLPASALVLFLILGTALAVMSLTMAKCFRTRH